MKSYFEKAVKDIAGACFNSLENSFRTLASLGLGLVEVALNLISPAFLRDAFVVLTNDDPQDDYLAYFYFGAYGVFFFSARATRSLRLIFLSAPAFDLSKKLTTEVISTYYERPFERRASITNADEIQHFSNAYGAISENFISGPFSKIFPSVTEMTILSIALLSEYKYVGLFLPGITLTFLLPTLIGSQCVGRAKSNCERKANKAFNSLIRRLEQYENTLISGNVHYEVNELEKSSELKVYLI